MAFWSAAKVGALLRRLDSLVLSNQRAFVENLSQGIVRAGDRCACSGCVRNRIEKYESVNSAKYLVATTFTLWSQQFMLIASPFH
jgi:hypothetical protein